MPDNTAATTAITTVTATTTTTATLTSDSSRASFPANGDYRLAQKLADLTKPVTELGECLLASALYDGDLRVAVLKFYDQKAGKFWLWRDNTGHRPYCYSKLPMEELEGLRGRKDVVDIVEEEKLDLLKDERVKVRKIITADPLAIGGGNNSIRDQVRAWEADIKYYENYAYDTGLRMGTYYLIEGGKVIPVEHPVPERVARSLDQILKKNPEEFVPYIKRWAELLGEPLCDFRRVAMDIEVDNEAGRLPDPEDPRQPVIAVSFFGDDEKIVYLLKSEESANGSANTGAELQGKPYQWRVFDKETELLRAVMSKIMDYPVVVTFNGDDFDLRYLQHRAEKLGIREDENPIQLERVAATLKHGVHIDLYQFFRNRSIQVYAFSNKYTEHTLGGVSEALLGKSKIEVGGEVGDLPLDMLADYCLNDSLLTYELTTIGGSVVMKLLLVISRIGKMPINDVSRLGVSNWIRSMLFYEHRRMGALIPRPDELAEKGGASSQAIIKGKKYKGGLVIEPKPGVFFGVSVLDFASLYPSLIKIHNLSYETVDCPHEECKKNAIPETSSWVCNKRSGIISLVTGSLRDLRVGHYKPLTKDQSLSATDRELYNVVTQGLKVFLNASYGVLGFETFAFYCLPVAEATAALGRYAITSTISKCTESGINVLYSDTDSLFLQNPSPEQVVQVTNWADKELGVELDLDKTYRYVAFSSRKKNYFGVLPDGTADIKGLTGKKSVDGRTPILVKENSQLKLTTVRDAFESYISGNRIEVTTVTENLDTIWVPISEATKHLVDEIFEVKSEKGRCLRLSGDHSVFSMNDQGELCALPTRSLRAGDVLVGAQLIRQEGTAKKLITGQYLSAGASDMVHWEDIQATSGIPLPEEIPLNKDLGLILGIYAAEGGKATKPGLRNNGVTQSVQVNPEACTAFEQAWMGLFGWAPKKYTKKQGTALFDVPSLCAELFAELCGENGRKKRVPPVAFESGDIFVRAFLRGLFSGSGYGDGKRVNLASASEELLVGTAYLLSRFDIDTRLRTMHSKGTSYYQLSIVGAASRLNFYRQVGFLQPRFNRSVEVSTQNKELIPLSTATLVALKSSIASKSGLARFRDVRLSRVRKYNLRKLNEYNAAIGLLLERADEGERSRLMRIARMINVRDVSYDEVASVRRVPGKCVMYDFAVPTFERFVAGNLSTLLHNSQTPEFLKQTFYEALKILSKVQTQADFERARAETKALLTKMITRLKNHQVPLPQLAFNVMMSKETRKYNGTTPQHVRAAMLLQGKGKEVKAGEIIAYVKTKTPPYVKPAEMAKVEEIDSDKYIEYAHSMFDQMLDALDFSFDEMLGATTLDSFWSG